MPITPINGVQVYWEVNGDAGEPVVLVHGSWGDHQNWAPVVPALSQSFRVLTYDRRGHSRSERPATQGSVHEDVADLAALVEHQGYGPAHIIGNSFGASIVLRLAAERPDLFRSMIVHEPPLFDILADEPGARSALAGRGESRHGLRDTENAPPLSETRRTTGAFRLSPSLHEPRASVPRSPWAFDHGLLAAAQGRIAAVVELLTAGDVTSGARAFVETVAFGPGAWDALPHDVRETFIFNAPTWLDETRDPAAMALDLGRLRTFAAPVLLTMGDQSPPFFALVVGRIAGALPLADTHTYRGVGHVPHLSHPEEYLRVVTRFLAAHAV